MNERKFSEFYRIFDMYRLEFIVGYANNENVKITPDDLLKYIVAEGGAVTSVNGRTGAVVLVPADVGLDRVNNTADLEKNVLSATKLNPGANINGVLFNGTQPIIIYDNTKLSIDGGVLNGNVTLNATPTNALHLITKQYVDSLESNKEPLITPGTTSQYWRGDKTWQELNRDAVGLGQVDNTSDLDKPISNATQSALNRKAEIYMTNTELAGDIGEIIQIDTSNINMPPGTILAFGQTLLSDAGFNGVGSGGTIGRIENLWQGTYTGSIDGNDTDTVFLITHNLGTTGIQITVRDSLTGISVYTTNTIINDNSVSITFDTAPATGGSFLVEITTIITPTRIGVRIISTSGEFNEGGGGFALPDYEHMENTNLISTVNGTWTSDRNGFIKIGSDLAMFEGSAWTINGQAVMDRSSAVGGKTDNILAVKSGDVIQNISPAGTTGIFCYFIPALNIGDGNGNISFDLISDQEIDDIWGNTLPDGSDIPDNVLTTESDIPWEQITETPTDLAGYGITDAVNKAGDTMTGNLEVESETPRLLVTSPNGSGSITAGSSGLDIRVEVQQGVEIPSRLLRFATAALEPNIKDALKLIDVITNSQIDFYYIWGSHNFDPNSKVNKAGDTMTGRLTINDNYPLFLGRAGAGPGTGFNQDDNLFIINKGLPSGTISLAIDGNGQVGNTAVNNALTLRAYDAASNSTIYKIWGEHNLPVEAGTWTPIWAGGTSAGTFTYVTQLGSYVRIGNMVFIDFSLNGTKVSGQTGVITIRGLPYQQISSSNRSAGSISWFEMANTPTWAGYTPWLVILDYNNFITIFKYKDGNMAQTDITTDVNSTMVIQGSIAYRIG